MIRKIIAKGQQRYQRFYLGRHWVLALDLGIIVLILVLAMAWWMIHDSQGLINRWLSDSLRPLTHRPVVYKQLPLTWQVNFKPVVISDGSEILTAEINYASQAKAAAIEINYVCQKQDNQQLLVIKKVADQNFRILDNQLIGEVVNQSTSSLTVDWQLADYQPKAERQVKIICQLQAKLGSQTWQEPSQEFVFKKSGTVQATAGAYFYTKEGDQVGIGPLPPIVGLPTSYLVTWTLDNDGGDLTDVQLAAQLADGVTWQGEAGLTGGNITYDAANRKVNWRIAAWPEAATQKQASFYIAINPTKDMVGRIVPLMKSGQWRATDSWAEKTWQGSLTALSSNLDYDSRSKGQGQVSDWPDR